MNDYKPFAFVLMPFDKKFSDIYNLGIKYAAEEQGVVAERVDEQQFSESILQRVYRQIENSDFIIADMTGQNPNVFYEVGYAHAKGKLCALITQSASDIPFDLKHHPHVIYDGSIENLRDLLSPKIKWMKEETKRKKSETITVKVEADNGFLDDREYAHYGSFELKVDLKNNSTRRSPEIEAIYINTATNWRLIANKAECPTEYDKGTKKNRHLISPRLQRLSPNAFLQEKVTFERQLWSRYTGEEKKEVYTMSGVLTIEVATSEGTISQDFPLEVEFDEIPF